MGRKRVVWSEAMGRRVVEAVAGGLSLDQVGRLDWAPCGGALRRWMARRPGFGAAMEAARAEALAAGRARRQAAWDGTRDEAAAEALRRMQAEGRSLWSVGRDTDMPCRASLDYWRRRTPGFAEAAAAVGPPGHVGASGRPRDFGPEAEAKILTRLAEGETLTAICRDADMPHAATVRYWRWTRPGFAEAYGRARAAQLEAMADAVVDIADAFGADWALGSGDAEAEWQRARLRIEARKWSVGQGRAPHTGRAIGGPPAQDEIASLSPEARQARIAVLIAKAQAEAEADTGG